jgi:hypothetical protein
MLTGAPGFADSNLSRMVERGKMKLTTRRRDGKQFGCWLGLRGHGSCRSTSNTDEPIGSVIMSGELCSFVDFLCEIWCDLLTISQKPVY